MELSPEDLQRFALAVRQLTYAVERCRSRYATQLGVGPVEVTALSHLFFDGPITPRELGTRIGLTTGSVTALVDRTEAAGFTVRNPNPDDRRSVFVTLTPTGRQAMEQLSAGNDNIVTYCMNTVYADRRAGDTAAKIDELIEVFTSIISGLDATPPIVS